jgi:hypothetical protein
MVTYTNWLFAMTLIAIVTASTALYFWSVARRKIAYLRKVEEELLNERKEKERSKRDLREARQEFERARSELREIAHDCSELLGNPPNPTDKELGTHLGTLATRLATTIEEMEVFNENAKEPLSAIAEEARRARQVDRKARFDDYYVVLSKATAEAKDTVARLRSALSTCVNLRAVLETGELDISAAQATINDIIKVLELSSAEYSVDDISLARVRCIHLDHARTICERMQSRKDNEGANRRRALTALEKFRTIKPTGSRDGFTPA